MTSRSMPEAAERGVPVRSLLGYMFALTVLLTVPIVPGDRQTHGYLTIGYYSTRALIDGLANIVLFAPVGFLMHGVLRLRNWPTAARTTATLVGAELFVVAMESLQSVVPGRHSSLIDVMVDFVGIALGVVAEMWRQRRA